MSNHQVKAIIPLITGIMMSCILYSQEFAILNDTLEWEYDNPTYAFNWFMPHAHMPSNWEDPYDYYNGKIYTLYEIISQPTSDSLALQFGIWQNQPGGGVNELMEDLRKLDGGAGSYAVHHDVPSSWWYSNNGVDFSRIDEILHLGINVWCMEPRSPVSCRTWGGNDAVWADRGRWFPLRVYTVVVAVADGFTFSGWNNYFGKITSTKSNNNQNTNFVIYPNPTDHFITIQTNYIDSYNLEIFNIYGKRILARNDVTGRSITVGLEDFFKGYYIIKISSGEKVQLTKLIKY